MRSSLCVVLMALCLVVWESSATPTLTEGDSSVQKVQEEEDAKVAGETTTTIAAKKVDQAGLDNGLKDNRDSKVVVDPLVIAATTTTTTAEIKVDNLQDTITDDVTPLVQQRKDSSEELNGLQEPATQIQQKDADKSKALGVLNQAKTITTTTTAPKDKGPQEDLLKTKVPPHTPAVQNPSEQQLSTGEEKTAKGENGDNAEPLAALKVEASATTTTTAPKKDSTDKDKEDTQNTITAGTDAGAAKKVKVPAVTSPATTLTKNNGDHADVKPPGKSGDKEKLLTEKLKSTTTTTTTTAEQTTSTVTLNTEKSIAQTATLPKEFKIPQSVDKMDGSSSTSLLFAFATVATFTVLNIAPVY